MLGKPKLGFQQNRFPGFSHCSSKQTSLQTIFYNTLVFLERAEQNFSSSEFPVKRDNSDEIGVGKKQVFWKKYWNIHFMLIIDFIWSKNCSALYKMFKKKTEQNTLNAIKTEYFNQPPSDF